MVACFPFARLAFLAVVAVARYALGQTVVPGGGFGGSCLLSGRLFRDHYLGMYCSNRATAIYGYNWTWIDVNWCVGNNQGQLTGANNGNYIASCSKCTALPDRSWQTNNVFSLGCSCLTSRSTVVNSTVNLNQFIFNTDGMLGCFTHLGNKSWAGPFPLPQSSGRLPA